MSGVQYDDDQGLHLRTSLGYTILEVNNVVVCADQESVSNLALDVSSVGLPVQTIGGADVALEIDAKRAIDQASA